MSVQAYQKNVWENPKASTGSRGAVVRNGKEKQIKPWGEHLEMDSRMPALGESRLGIRFNECIRKQGHVRT